MVDLPRQGEGAATLESMIESRDVVGIAQWLDTCQGAEAVRTLSALSDESREQMLHLLTPEDAADVIEQLPEPQALDALGDLDPAQAARIIENSPATSKLICWARWTRRKPTRSSAPCPRKTPTKFDAWRRTRRTSPAG